MTTLSVPIYSKNLNKFIDHGSIAMATHDQYMKIKWCNNAFISMFKYKDNLIGKTLFDLCPKEVDRVSRFIRKFRDSKNSTISTSLHMLTGEGINRYIVITSEKFLSDDGNINEIISYFRDDTKRLIREDRVKTALELSSQVSKHRGLFVSKIVHELRSPLTSLMMSIKKDSEAMKHAISLARQIKNMTYATKFEMGEVVVPTDEPICVSELLSNSIELSKLGIAKEINSIEKTYIKKNGEITSDLYLLLDETLVSTVLSEILRNCFELNNVLIDISVNFDIEREVCCFRISDNGPGMEMEWIMRIFQDFWGGRSIKEPESIKQSIKNDKHGLGIGLNVCYNIIQCMDSVLDVQTSRNGTIFSFEIETSVCNETDYLNLKEKSYKNIPISDILYNWENIDMKDDMRNDRVLTSELAIEEIKEKESIFENKKTKKIGFFDKFKTYVSKRSNKYVDTESDIPDESLSSISIANAPISSSKNNYSTNNDRKTNRSRSSENISKDSNRKSICTNDDLQPHVLVVDDHTTVRKSCGKMLMKLGCTFDTASNGALAIEKVKSHHEYYYDLILMDLRMPLMDGLEATKIIKDDLKLNIPIVAFTAEDSIDIFKEALDCGIIGFLHKPATQQNLEEIVDKFSRKM